LCSCRHCQWFCAGPARHQRRGSYSPGKKTRTDWPGQHNNLNTYALGRPAQNMFMSRSRRFSKGRITFAEYFTGKGASPTNYCWCQKSSDFPFVWYQNIRSASFTFVTIHASDRQTNGRT